MAQDKLTREERLDAARKQIEIIKKDLNLTNEDILEILRPDAQMSELADQLEAGASADIWYDAHQFEDASAETLIEDTQSAMTSAAKILRSL